MTSTTCKKTAAHFAVGDIVHNSRLQGEYRVRSKSQTADDDIILCEPYNDIARSEVENGIPGDTWLDGWMKCNLLTLVVIDDMVGAAEWRRARREWTRLATTPTTGTPP